MNTPTIIVAEDHPMFRAALVLTLRAFPVQEIRIRDAAGAFRVIYVAKFTDAFMSCIVSGRPLRELARRILIWPPNVTRN